MFCLPEPKSKKGGGKKIKEKRKREKGRKEKKEFPYTGENVETMVSREVAIPSFMATAGSLEHCTLENKTIKIAI